MDQWTLLELLGVDGQPGKDTAETGVAAGDVRICTCISMLANHLVIGMRGRLP